MSNVGFRENKSIAGHTWFTDGRDPRYCRFCMRSLDDHIEPRMYDGKPINSIEDLAAMIEDRRKEAETLGLQAARQAFRSIEKNLSTSGRYARTGGLTFGTIDAVLAGLIHEAEGTDAEGDRKGKGA